MALRLRAGTFPVFASMWNFFENVAVFCQQRVGFGPPLEGAGLSAAGTIRDEVRGKSGQEITDQFCGFPLVLCATEHDAVLAHCIQRL